MSYAPGLGFSKLRQWFDKQKEAVRQTRATGVTHCASPFVVNPLYDATSSEEVLRTRCIAPKTYDQLTDAGMPDYGKVAVADQLKPAPGDPVVEQVIEQMKAKPVMTDGFAPMQPQPSGELPTLIPSGMKAYVDPTFLIAGGLLAIAVVVLRK